MAKVDVTDPFYTISGKLNKKDEMVFRTRNGKTSQYKMKNPEFTGSEKQMKQLDLVKKANMLVSEEIKSVERKMYWKTVAEDESNKYKTARGAAFAHFLAELKSEI